MIQLAVVILAQSGLLILTTLFSFILLRKAPELCSFTVARRCVRLLVLLSLLIPCHALVIPSTVLPKPRMQVFTKDERVPRAQRQYVFEAGKPSKSQSSSVSIPQWFFMGFFALAFLGATMSLGLFLFQCLKLTRFLKSCEVLKQNGTLSIVSSLDTGGAFSVSFFRRAWVVIPFQITNPRTRRLVICHELQHLKSNDTVWIMFIEVLKRLYFWNPVLILLRNTHRELCELSCDEALTGRVPARDYAVALINAAETVLASEKRFASAAHFSAAALILERRIKMCLNKPNRKVSWLFVPLIGVLTLTFGIFSIASATLMSQKRLSRSEAGKYFELANQGSQIPVELNDLVLERLNKIVGSVEGKKRMKEALQRLPQYRDLFLGQARQYDIPDDIMAVAISESGLRNDATSPPPWRAAGLWQFIPETARHYGMVVNGKLDERLNPEKATRGAMMYYRFLFDEFQDWRLAVRAYNDGENKVRSLIESHRTSDPWELERKEPSGYLSQVIATIVILKNPELVD